MNVAANLIIPVDFIIVRFASKPHHWMRRSHAGVRAWLDRRQIEFVRDGRTVLYELPEGLQRYTIVTRELADELSTFAYEIKRGLAALSLTKMARVRQPLTREEYGYLVDAGIQVIL